MSPVETLTAGADRRAAPPAPGALAEDLARKLAPASGAAPAGPFLEAIAEAFAGATRHRVHVNCEPGLTLGAAEFAPIGVIVSEAIDNALRHGFPMDRQGDVWVKLLESEGRLKLSIKDNGAGMRDAIQGGHGCAVIESLAEQLGGYAKIGSAPFGGGLVTVVYRRG